MCFLNWSMVGFPDSSVGKESSCNTGDPGLIPGSGRSAGEGNGYPLQYSWAFPVAQLIKNPPAMWETWVWSLGWEDPWRRERLPTPVFRSGEFHGLYSPWESQRVGHDWATFTLTHSWFTMFQVYSKIIQLYIFMNIFQILFHCRLL